MAEHSTEAVVRGGVMTRRFLVRAGIGIGAATMLSACAPAAPTAAPGSTVGAAPASVVPTKAAAGTLTFATESLGPAGYIPSRQDNSAGALAVATFGETLVEQKPDRSKGPRLAKAWTVSTDGSTYTFDLRSDVKWHDGTAFTSEDVKYTLEQATAEGSVHPRATQWRNLSSIDTPSPDRVVLHLKTPDLSTVTNCSDLVSTHRSTRVRT